MFVELHAVQSFSLSNLNRDDTGAPKSLTFGGVRRARISSQCQKRAMRTIEEFATATQLPLGVRTRHLADLLLDALGNKDDIHHAVSTAVAGLYSGQKDGKNEALTFVSNDEVEALAGQIRERWDALANEKGREAAVKEVNKWALRNLTGATSAPDVALFGRMMATEPRYGLEAACQVAHAIGTHRMTVDPDYFTAVDDYPDREETGAGHVDYAEFNASTFYRYARVDIGQLTRNLKGNTDVVRATLTGFAHAFVTAVPGGKQNSSAAFNPPALVVAVVRADGVGWNLAGAFETPIVANGHGTVTPSIAALDTLYGQLTTMYATNTIRNVAALSLTDAGLDNLAPYRVLTFADWIKATVDPAL